jgi:hypothetical protein
MQIPLSHIKTHSTVERVRTDSILNPLLWLCGIIVSFGLSETYFSEGYAKIFFALLWLSP